MDARGGSSPRYNKYPTDDDAAYGKRASGSAAMGLPQEQPRTLRKEKELVDVNVPRPREMTPERQARDFHHHQGMSNEEFFDTKERMVASGCSFLFQ